MAPVLRYEDFSGQISPDRAREIMLAEPNDAPLLSYMLGANLVGTAFNAVVTWFSDALGALRTQINNGAGYDDDDTSLVVDDGTVFERNTLAYLEATGELVLVTAVSGNTLTVVRGIGATSGAAIADNAYIRRVGYAAGEGGSSPTASVAGQTEKTNYVQTFKKSIKLTGLTQRVRQDTEDQRLYQRRRKLIELKRDLEQALIFGYKSADQVDSDGNRVRTMDGLIAAISTHVTNQAGTLSWAQLMTAAQSWFRYGSARKLLLGGPTLIETIHSLAYGKLQVQNNASTFGLDISTLVTPHGTLDLLHTWALKDGFAGTGIVIDPAEVMLRFTQGGQIALQTDIQNRDEDAIKDQWMGEGTLQYGNEATHARIYGVTGAG